MSARTCRSHNSPARAAPSEGVSSQTVRSRVSNVNVAVAAWETTYLRSAAHFSDSSAARATSLFWVAITVGRLTGGWVARRVHVGLLVSSSLVMVAVSLVVAGLPGLGLTGYTAAGLFLAPVFPATFAWFSGTRPSSLAMTLVFSSGVLGPANFSSMWKW